jgi:dTDP-4-dehydrorhamnose 3,5-epimerase
MMAMRRLDTNLDGPILLEPEVHGDARGFFLETARANVLAELGITDTFVQHNHSRSAHAVLRGMHYQAGMAKLVRCARGAILDVLVDIRPQSPSYGHWESFELSDENHHQLYCPDGFAHGFCVLSDVADVVYLCTDYYDAERESGFRFDDPEVRISWPDLDFVVSERDRNAPLLRSTQQAAH